MVQISNTLIIAFLVSPALSFPISKAQDLQIHTAELAARDTGSGSSCKKINKFFKPSNIGKVTSVASLVIRDDIHEACKHALGDLQAIAARDPNLSSFVNRHNVDKKASVASLVIRDEYPELSERDLEHLQDLAARDPSIGSFFRKNFFNPSHIDKVAKEASKLASILKREDDLLDLPERSADCLREFTARDFEYFDELASRDPGFGSFFRKIKKFVNMRNIKKAAGIASLVIREDLPVDDIFEGDFSSEMNRLD